MRNICGKNKNFIPRAEEKIRKSREKFAKDRLEKRQVFLGKILALSFLFEIVLIFIKNHIVMDLLRFLAIGGMCVMATSIIAMLHNYISYKAFNNVLQKVSTCKHTEENTDDSSK